jgi:hypothetical protein
MGPSPRELVVGSPSSGGWWESLPSHQLDAPMSFFVYAAAIVPYLMLESSAGRPGGERMGSTAHAGRESTEQLWARRQTSSSQSR